METHVAELPLMVATGSHTRCWAPTALLQRDSGTFGGHRRQKIYGRLDCPAARRAINAGGYVAHRVFFADEPTAVTDGYKPCGACLPAANRRWKTR